MSDAFVSKENVPKKPVITSVRPYSNLVIPEVFKKTEVSRTRKNINCVIGRSTTKRWLIGDGWMSGWKKEYWNNGMPSLKASPDRKQNIPIKPWS